MYHSFPQINPLNPQLSLIAQGESPNQIETTVLVDTGFNGYLALPKQMASTLGLEFSESKIRVGVADGSIFDFLVSKIKVLKLSSIYLEWELDCLLTNDDEVILGTQFLQEFCLRFKSGFVVDFIHQNILFREI